MSRGMNSRLQAMCVALVAGHFILASAGCRKKPSFNPVELTGPVEQTTESATQGGGELDWPAPARLQLNNDARLDWLVEPRRATSHVRYVIGTAVLREEHAQAAISAAALMLEQRLGRRLAKYRATISWSAQADRLELHVEVSSANERQVLAALGGLLSEKRPQKDLETARGTLASRPVPDRISSLGNQQVDAIFHQIAGNKVEPEVAIAEVSANHLQRAYEALSDPRMAWLIVHSPNAPSDAMGAIEELTTRWKSRGLLHRQTLDVAQRLRGTRKARKTALAPAVQQPISAIEAKAGDPSALVWTFATRPATLADRVALRMVARVLQEEYDVRLVQSGDLAFMQTRLPLSEDPERATERFHDFLRTYQKVCHEGVSAQRLQQARDIWRGGRWVQASFEGEDRTALWSQAYDLSTSEAEMEHALQREDAALAALTVESMTDVCQRLASPWKSPVVSNWSIVSPNAAVKSAVENTRQQVQSGAKPLPGDE